MSRIASVAWVVCFAAGGCAGDSGPNAAIRLADASADAGIAFVHADGSSGRRYIVEAMSAGLATFDYDLDGLIDVYFLNGAALPGSTYPTAPTNALYRNRGGWSFVDCSVSSGLDDRGFGLGVAVGDCDEDGFPDVYLNNHGPNALLVNMGDGTFRDATTSAGVGNGDLVGAGTVSPTSTATVISTSTSAITWPSTPPPGTNGRSTAFPPTRRLATSRVCPIGSIATRGMARSMTRARSPGWRPGPPGPWGVSRPTWMVTGTRTCSS